MEPGSSAGEYQIQWLKHSHPADTDSDAEEVPPPAKKARRCAGKKISHRQTTPQESQEVTKKLVSASEALTPPFATTKTANEVFDFFTDELTMIFRRGMTDGIQQLLSSCQTALGVKLDLLILIEYLRSNNLLAGGDLEMMLDQETLLNYIRDDLLSHPGHVLSRLQRLEVPTGDRYRPQWSMGLLLERFPELDKKLQTSVSYEQFSEWQTKAQAGDIEAEFQLKAQLIKTPQPLPWLINLRLAQGKTFEDIFEEIRLDHRNLLGKSKNIKDFFLDLIKTTEEQMQILPEFAGYLKPEWLKQETDVAFKERITRAVVQHSIHSKQFSDALFSQLVEHIDMPSDYCSWYQFIQSQPGGSSVDLTFGHTPQQLKQQLAKGSKRLQKIALHSLIYLASGENSEARVVLADHLYEVFDRLQPVVDCFSLWDIPCPDSEGWSVSSLKQLMCRKTKVTFMAVCQTAKGHFQLPDAFTGKKMQCLSLEGGGDQVFERKKLDDLVGVESSRREGMGVFAKVPFAAYEVIGEYRGNQVLRMPIAADVLHPIQDQVQFKPSAKVPRLNILLKSSPEPQFMDQKDSYVAWGVVRQTVETAESSPWQLLGEHGAEMGFDGNDGGNSLCYLNHDDDPNVILLSAINPEMIDWVDSQNRFYLKPEAVPHKDMKLLVVALKNINPGESDGASELTFDYHPDRQGEIDFSLVGTDILAQPERFFLLDGQHRVVLKNEFQPDTVPPQFALFGQYDDSSDSVLEAMLADYHYPGTEILSEEDVIPIYGSRPPVYVANLDAVPEGLKEYDLLYKRGYMGEKAVIEKAIQEDMKALAYMAFRYMSSHYMKDLDDRLTPYTLIQGRLKCRKIRTSAKNLFKAIETFIPMAEFQLMGFLSAVALSDMVSQGDAEAENYIRRWLIHAISIERSPSDICRKLKMYKVGFPSKNITSGKEWSVEKMCEVLPGIKTFYCGISETRLEELYRQGCRDKQNNNYKEEKIPPLLTDAARSGSQKALQYYIFYWCSNFEGDNRDKIVRPDLKSDKNPKSYQGLSRIVTKLKSAEIPNPLSDKGENWTTRYLVKYIIDFIDDFDETMKDNDIILCALAHSENKNQHERWEALKRFVWRHLNQGADLESLIKRLSSKDMKFPLPAGHTGWNLAALADFIQKNYSDKVVFSLPLDDLCALIPDEPLLGSSHYRIELHLRAKLKQPGAFDRMLTKEMKILKDAGKVANWIRNFWPEEVWTKDRIRNELKKIQSSSKSSDKSSSESLAEQEFI